MRVSSPAMMMLMSSRGRVADQWKKRRTRDGKLGSSSFRGELHETSATKRFSLLMLVDDVRCSFTGCVVTKAKSRPPLLHFPPHILVLSH